MEDTIAAIATALSESGIGILRISGPEAVDIADKIIRNQNGKHFLREIASHTIHYGFVVDDQKVSIVDEVLVLLMKSPRSYTMEDVVEIHCHGGVRVVRSVLELTLRAGARLAEPGEFTKRAFLNGRIDLSEAEAVMDLISSRSDAAVRSSVAQLQGALSDRIQELRAAILYESARIESAIDDPEHFDLDSLGDYPAYLSGRVSEWMALLGDLLRSFEQGRILREGVRAVLLGKPNTGKSSILNRLAGSDRAIVTHLPGTTRDTLEERVLLGDVVLCLTDTAGMRDTSDPIERIGVERARKALEEADLVLLVVDGSKFLELEDLAIFPLVSGKKCIVLANKADLGRKIPKDEFFAHFSFVVPMKNPPSAGDSCGSNGEQGAGGEDMDAAFLPFSAATGEGVPELTKQIEEWFLAGELSADSGGVVVTNLRHKEAIERAQESLERVRQSIADGMAEDFYSIDLLSAYAELGKITGESVGEDLIEEIFSKFCMGK